MGVGATIDIEKLKPPLPEVLIALEDEDKRAAFESLGFSPAGAGPDFSLEEREISSVRLEKSV